MNIFDDTCKNMLVADLANVIVHHLKSIFRTLILCDILSLKRVSSSLLNSMLFMWSTWHTMPQIYLSIYLCLYLSIYLSINLSIYIHIYENLPRNAVQTTPSSEQRKQEPVNVFSTLCWQVNSQLWHRVLKPLSLQIAISHWDWAVAG